MKTGGTLNFLKRAGAILMLLAIFASSCNKYADDFKQLNTKLDALAITVNGVTQLTTDLATVKANVASLITAVAALPTTASITTLTNGLTTANANIVLIQTALTNLSTLVGTKASSAEVAAVTTNIKAELTTQLTVVNNAIAAAKAAIDAAKLANDAQTVTLQTAIVNGNTALMALIQTQIDALALQIANLADNTTVSDALLQTSVDGLTVLLNAQKTILDQILASVNMYNGDVTISTLAEMRFFYGKLSQMNIINGKVTINTTNLTNKLDTVNMITSKITAVIGTGSNVSVTSVANAIVLDLAQLVSVSGAYSVSGVDISDSNLSSVGGDFTVYYDGAYTFPNLSTIGGSLFIVNYPYVSGTSSGTTSINFPGITSVATGTVIHDVATGGTAGELTYAKALTINLSGKIPVTKLTAIAATAITLGATNYTSGLTLTSSTAAAATIDLSAATGSTSTGLISITAYKGSSVLLTNLTNAPNGLTINFGASSSTNSATVNLTALASCGTTSTTELKLTGPATVTLPALVTGLVESDATTVTMAVHQWANPAVLSKVITLTLGNVAANVDASNYGSTLVTLAVSGKANADYSALTGSVTATASNTALKTITIGGTTGSQLKSVSASDAAALTALTTTGVVNELTINNCDALVGVTLAHTHDVTAAGSTLIVTNNAALTSLIPTVLDYPNIITVASNPVLATLDLSSYHTPLLAASTAITTITIGSNALTGDYVNALPITATSAYVETKITSVTLHSLKVLVAAYPTSTTTRPLLNLACDIDKVTLGGVTGNATLGARIQADYAASHNAANGAPFELGNSITGMATAFKNVTP